MLLGPTKLWKIKYTVYTYAQSNNFKSGTPIPVHGQRLKKWKTGSPKFFFFLYEWYYISICWVAQIRNIITINWVHFKFVNLLSKPFFPLWIRLWDMSVSSTVIHQSLNGICYWYGVMGFYSYDHFLVYSTVRAIYVASSMLFSLQLLFIEYLHVWSLSQKDEHLFQGEERNINAYWPTYHYQSLLQLFIQKQQ